MPSRIVVDSLPWRNLSVLLCLMLVLLPGLPRISPAASPSGVTQPPGRAEQLNGTWVPDVDATINRFAEERTRPMEPYELADLRERIAASGLVLDITGRRATERGSGVEYHFSLDSVTESGETVVITGERRRYTIRMRDDGSILVGQGIIMRKAD